MAAKNPSLVGPTQPDVENPPPKRKHYVIIVHGTFNAPRQSPEGEFLDLHQKWWAPGGRAKTGLPFCEKLCEKLSEKFAQGKGEIPGDAVWADMSDPEIEGITEVFFWGAKNSDASREEGAQRLAERVMKIRLAQPGALVHFVAHSHGGNVVLRAVEIILGELGELGVEQLFGGLRKRTWGEWLCSGSATLANRRLEQVLERHGNASFEGSTGRGVDPIEADKLQQGFRDNLEDQGAQKLGLEGEQPGVFGQLKTGSEPSLGSGLDGGAKSGFSAAAEFLARFGGELREQTSPPDQDEFVRTHYSSLASVNPLGRMVFLGTPFLTKHETPYRDALVAILWFVTISATCWGISLTCSGWSKHFGLKTFGIVLLVGAFCLAVFLDGFQGKVDPMKPYRPVAHAAGNVYHLTKLPWSPGMGALVVHSGILDEANFALRSTAPLIKAYVVPEVDQSFNLQPWKTLPADLRRATTLRYLPVPTNCYSRTGRKAPIFNAEIMIYTCIIAVLSFILRLLLLPAVHICKRIVINGLQKVLVHVVLGTGSAEKGVSGAKLTVSETLKLDQLVEFESGVDGELSGEVNGEVSGGVSGRVSGEASGETQAANGASGGFKGEVSGGVSSETRAADGAKSGVSGRFSGGVNSGVNGKIGAADGVSGGVSGRFSGQNLAAAPVGKSFVVHWNVQHLILNRGANSLGTPGQKEPRFDFLLEPRQRLASASSAHAEIATGESDRAPDNSVVGALVRAGCFDRLEESEREELLLIAQMLEERQKEITGQVEVRHSLYYSQIEIVDVMAEFLQAGAGEDLLRLIASR